MSKIVQHITIIIISLVISYSFFGKNLDAKMGIIDDHRYLTYKVTNNPNMVINNFINSPEFISFGKSTRFRPIFTLIDNLQTYFWGMNAHYWYLTNIIIFTIFIFSCFYTTKLLFNSKIAILFTIVTVSQSYLANIFTRLGTAEAWTILGTSLYSMGFSSAYKKYSNNRNDTTFEWILMTIGALITIGSKENFSIMFILFISLLIYIIRIKKLQVISVVSSLLLLISNLYEIIYIVKVQNTQGVDFYQNDSNLLSRLIKIFDGIKNTNTEIFTSAIIVFTILIFIEIILRKQKKLNSLNLIINSTIVTLISTVIIFFNLYIYNGIFYINHRYSFPSIIICQIIWLCNFCLLNQITSVIFPNKIAILRNITYISLFILFTFLSIKNLKYCQKISRINVQATNNFQEKLKAIEIEIQKCPNCVIILNSFHPVDYEPLLLSTPRYLENDGIHNKLMVNTSFNSETINSPLTKWLTDGISNYKTNGGTYFIPYQNLDKNCLIIDYSGRTTNSKCKVIGQLWPIGDYIY